MPESSGPEAGLRTYNFILTIKSDTEVSADMVENAVGFFLDELYGFDCRVSVEPLGEINFKESN